MPNANKLETWLAANHKSQVWLAREVGVTQAMISYIIAGERAVPFWLANDIARICGLKPAEVGRIFIPKGRKRRGKEGSKQGASA